MAAESQRASRLTLTKPSSLMASSILPHSHLLLHGPACISATVPRSVAISLLTPEPRERTNSASGDLESWPIHRYAALAFPAKASVTQSSKSRLLLSLLFAMALRRKESTNLAAPVAFTSCRFQASSNMGGGGDGIMGGSMVSGEVLLPGPASNRGDPMAQGAE